VDPNCQSVHYIAFPKLSVWVCRNSNKTFCFWSLPEQSISGPSTSELNDHIFLSHMRLPHPGRPGPRIYILQEQGSPVIPPGTGCLFRRLLRFSELRSKYSDQPPHWILTIEVEVNLRPTVSRPVCPDVRCPSWTSDQFIFLLEISFRQLRLCYSVYNCFWA
jgi:hypothetical protein